MSNAVEIIVEDSRARHILSAVTSSGHAARSVAGRAAVNALKSHLRKLDASRPNRLGGRRSHFYSQAAASTHYRLSSDGAQVAVTHTGFALRYYGGVIRPVRAKALAIPARPELYGYRPRERSEDMFVRWKRGSSTGALVARLGGNLRVLYWLVSKATIPADKSLLPDHSTISRAVSRELESFIARQAARAKGAK
jgi:hypothetical protein